MSDYEPYAALGWVDFSNNSRQKLLQVLSALNGSGTIDELGIGAIRNAFSNTLFPGTSVLMTRAKYYLLIPYILKDFLAEKTTKPAKNYFFEKELQLVDQLTKTYSDNLEGSGIIGYTIALENANRKKQQLAAQPASTSYWGGIRRLGLYGGEASLGNLLSHLDQIKKEQWTLDQIPDDQGSKDDIGVDSDDNNLFNVPYKRKWWQELRMELTEKEQNFLKHKIQDTCPNSLFAYLLSKDELSKLVISAKNGIAELEEFLKGFNVPHSITTCLETATRFWRIIRGAHILYNILLQERFGLDEELKAQFHTEWETWKLEMKDLEWNKFDLKTLWLIVESESYTRRETRFFVDRWIKHAKEQNFDRNILDKLVENQERSVKGKRAKLYNIQDIRFQERQGLTEMEFRFRNVRRLIDDITNRTEDA